MKNQRILASVASLCLAAGIGLAGCSKSNNSQPAQQPAAAAGQPAAPTQNPSASGPAEAQNQAAQAPEPPPPPQPTTVDIPAGTRLRVRLDQDLGSKISQPGETFTATVVDPVIVNGQTIIPREAQAEGLVVDAKALGRFKGGAMLELRLERVRTRWGSYPVSTSTMSQVEQGKGKRTAGFAGGGGALGAIIGGIAGGGKGALIGGLAGAGAGTAGTALTGNKQIVLPAETLLTFRIEHPVHVTQK